MNELQIKTSIWVLGLVFFCSTAGRAQEEFEPLNNKVMYSKFYIADFFNDSSRWAWELDVVYRRQSEQGGFQIWENPLRYSIRLWLSYQFTKMTRVSFNPIGLFQSAPRFPLESDLNRPFERELRTTLQINHSSFYDRFNFTHRIRIESRWRDIDFLEGPSHNWRLRYRIRMRVPLNTDYFYKNNTLYTSNYHEFHLEWGSGHGTNVFTQNRNFVGLGYRFWDWTRVELGFLYQLNTRSNNRQLDVSMGPMFYIFMDILSRNQRKYQYSF
jgi:hypothetical protein